MTNSSDSYVLAAPQFIPTSTDDLLVTPTGGLQGRLADKLASASSLTLQNQGTPLGTFNTLNADASVTFTDEGSGVAGVAASGGALTVAGDISGSVPGVTSLTLAGGFTVTGSTPNATATSSGGGAPAIVNITTGSTPVDLDAPTANTVYIITSGGTKGVETINLPAFGSYADAQVGRTISFIWIGQTSPVDAPTISYVNLNGDTLAVCLNPFGGGFSGVYSGPVLLISLTSDGQQWYQATAVGSATLAPAATTGTSIIFHSPGGKVTAQGIAAATSLNLTMTNGFICETSSVTVNAFANDDATPVFVVGADVSNGQVVIKLAFALFTGDIALNFSVAP